LMSATGQQTFNRSYGYDSLNRLQSMSAPGSPCSGLSWTVDPWGNRTDQTPTGGTCNPFHSGVATVQNRFMPPYQYDAAGNMTYDGAHSYTYDAENRITKVDGGATASYAYDPMGRRVQKIIGGATTSYVYDLAGNSFLETQGSNWVTFYLDFAGVLRAQYKNGVTSFIHRDHLGSTRLVTAMNQSPTDNLDYLPFGEQVSGDTATSHKFTGKERDSESGLDNFGARYNASSMGRFMSADPGNAGAINADPQSWNAYAYVRNNPVNLTDPTGAVLCRPANSAESEQGIGLVCDVSDSQYVHSSRAEQAAYDQAGYKHYDSNGDTQSDKAAWAERNGNVSNDYVGDVLIFLGVLAAVRGAEPPPPDPRLPQDKRRESEHPSPPSANNGNSTIGTNPNQDAALRRDIQQAQQDGATDIRVNQEQVNAQGVRVGQNRPDLQYTDRNGIRHYTEYDQDPASGAAHAQRIRANDPAGVIDTKTVK
jgi:RHS repeat-associated protein